jgi:hypothetical protein
LSDPHLGAIDGRLRLFDGMIQIRIPYAPDQLVLIDFLADIDEPLIENAGDGRVDRLGFLSLEASGKSDFGSLEDSRGNRRWSNRHGLSPVFDRYES